MLKGTVIYKHDKIVMKEKCGEMDIAERRTSSASRNDRNKMH